MLLGAFDFAAQTSQAIRTNHKTFRPSLFPPVVSKLFADSATFRLLLSFCQIILSTGVGHVVCASGCLGCLGRLGALPFKDIRKPGMIEALEPKNAQSDNNIINPVATGVKKIAAHLKGLGAGSKDPHLLTFCCAFQLSQAHVHRQKWP